MLCDNVRPEGVIDNMENSQSTKYDMKLEKLFATFTAEQKFLFDDWQEENILLISLVAVENRRIGFEEGLRTATQLLAGLSVKYFP